MLSFISNTLPHLIFFSHKITHKTSWGKNTKKKKNSVCNNTDLTEDLTEGILGKNKAYVIIV